MNDLFRSFLPMQNPLGFGASDFIELALAVLLVLSVLVKPSWVQLLRDRLAPRTAWCMLILAALPVVLRLLMAWQYPIPTPYVSDDFSYLLAADTLRHFRLANPVHPMHQFFETFFVLQEPSYSSIFPLGQALILALGWTLFGIPWAGVALSIGAFCALCYWMLRAWTTPGWALLGGLLAVIEFGPLNQWMNSYWGGAVSACAGCLVFGALPRLRDGRRRDAVWLGLGLALQFLTRPYESLFLDASVILFLLPALRRPIELRTLARVIPFILAPLLPAIGLSLLQNKQVTGSWTTLPYELSRYQYGVPATFTVQPNPTPHRTLTREQELDYVLQCQIHGQGADTFGSYFERLGTRGKYVRFFLLVPLYLALPFFLPSLRQYRFLWVGVTILLFALGSNFYPYFYTHYVAAIACVAILVSVTGLERLSRFRLAASTLIISLCFAHFAFWYGMFLCGNQDFARAVRRYITWDAVNQGDPEGRIAIRKQLEESPGQQLVFVRYYPQHHFQEWVHNWADIDASRIVWARDLGEEEDKKLLDYYPNRTAWLLEPDFRPPRLRPYPR